MLNALFEVPVFMSAKTAAFTTDVRSVIGLIAAIIAAVLAAHASWLITGRVISWRQRADQDKL